MLERYTASFKKQLIAVWERNSQSAALTPKCNIVAARLAAHRRQVKNQTRRADVELLFVGPGAGYPRFISAVRVLDFPS